MKRISILGSTGSIGTNTLSIIRDLEFELIGIASGDNVELLAKQAAIYRPKFVAIARESRYQRLKDLLRGTNIKILVGEEGVLHIASLAENDVVVSSIMGMAGLKPTMAAISNCAHVAIANKEAIICGGNVLLTEAKKYNTLLVPIDSEHNSILQLLDGELKSDRDFLDKVIITASGGPFLNSSLEKLKNVTVEQAINHPNWNMGAKISVDSATLMNKGLELIEASILFGIDHSLIDVIIHPQSIVHAMVQYNDGSTKAFLSNPDMKLHIAHAITYPSRAKIKHEPLDLSLISTLNFQKVDHDKFKAINIARQALNEGHFSIIALNAINEVAVNCFLNKRICFLDIVNTIEKIMENIDVRNVESLEDIMEVDGVFRNRALNYLNNYYKA